MVKAEVSKPLYDRDFLVKRGQVWARRPQPMQAPLRADNILDEEVRAIQNSVKAIAPQALVNIGPVIDKCRCENGPQCSNQVWVIAERAEHKEGYSLAKIDGAWGISPLQEWWLEYDELRQRQVETSDPTEFQHLLTASMQMVRDFELCVDKD